METSTVPRKVTTIAQAFFLLGISRGISSRDEVMQAFRSRVKAAARSGSYVGDMDDLVQAKEFLLEALARVQAEAEKARAKQRAEAQARAERKRQAEARKKREPLQIGPASAQYYARQAAQMRKVQEQIVTIWYIKRKEEKTMQEQKAMQPKSALIDSALTLLQTRKSELEQIRQREQKIAEELSRLQARRNELEQSVQTANALAEQMLAILGGIVN